MIVIDYDNLQAQIKSKKSKVIYLYEGHASLDYSSVTIRPFDKLISTTTTEELSQQLEDFSKVYADKFSCFIHTADNGVEKQGFFMHVDLGIRKSRSIASPAAPGHPVDYNSVKADILRELTEAKKLEVLQEQLKSANALVATKDLMSEKLASVLIQMLQQLGMLNPGGVMQGLQPEAAQPPAPTTAIEAAAAAPVQVPVASSTPEEALTYFREQLGDEALMKLDAKIRAAPALINTLKAFAG